MNNDFEKCEKCGTRPVINKELEAFRLQVTAYKWLWLVISIMILINYVSSIVGTNKEIRDQLTEILQNQEQIKSSVIKPESGI
ncbi:hypothetical protein MASR1M12_00700 [Erysipelotrichia bacterium]